MFKKATLLVFSFFFSTIVLSAAPTPTINSEGAILIEPSTGEILYSKNANEKFYPASTTKILSTLILIEDLDPTTLITKSFESIKNVPADSSHIGLNAGDQYSAEDGFHAILMSSDNFVAYDMAIKDAGNLPNFIVKMNTKATLLGTTSSHFVNPHGYHDVNHYTTPYDLAKIAIGAFNNPHFEKVAGTAVYPFKTISNGKTISLTHTAPLLNKSSQLYNAHVVGAKTGFHDEAGRTLVAKAHYNNIDLIAVVMKTLNPNQFIDVNKLFDYGSKNFSITTSASGLPSLVNHSYSPWAKDYVDYSISKGWINTYNVNYGDFIYKDKFISLVTQSIPSEYASVITQYINYPNTYVSSGSLLLTKAEAAVLLTNMIQSLNLHPHKYYKTVNITDITDLSPSVKNAIDFTTSIKLLGTPSGAFNPNHNLTYEEALGIACKLEVIFKTSIPYIFTI